jgi:amidase
MRITRIGAIIASALMAASLVGSTTIAQGPEMPSGEMSAEDRAAIDAIAEGMLQSVAEVPAVYLGIWDPERGAYVAAYGTADRETGRLANVEDTFRIGSISKTFTAAVILQLVDEGLVSLGDTVANADADLAARFPALAELSIEQLLGMRSGIPDYMNIPDGAVGPTAQDPSTVWEPDDLIAFGVAGDIQPPGTGGYSTTNYIALQEIAESITGTPLAELIRTRLTDPLGMPDTALPPNADTTLPEPSAHGYIGPTCVSDIEESGGAAPVWTDTTTWNASYGQGGGGMHSTIEDLGRWAASLAGSSTLSEGLAATRLEPAYELDPLRDYGLGIVKFGPTYGHTGEALGWEGWSFHDPGSGVTLVLFTNSCGVADVTLDSMTQLYAPLADALAEARAQLFGGFEGPAEPPEPLQALDFTPFQAALEALDPDRLAALDELVVEATFDDLQAAMTAGGLSSVELTSYYLARTRDLDVDGLRSMLELNPDALATAADLDAEREAGTVRGSLHGIPISLKGNIGTGDAMHTTAGAAALAGSRSDRDAAIAARLREAGAVIIGKANLSEWAYWMHRGPSGYSALGGQVLSPYDPVLDPLGSSTGSAVGTSANLVAGSIGTETLGSIIAPAAANGVVGVHPSLGLVSRDRVIPVTDQTDTPGPITRTVTDSAILLSAIAGVDPEDPVTSEAADLDGTDFTTFLDTEALRSARVGVWTGLPDGLLGDMSAEEYFELLGMGPAIASLGAAGAEVVPVWGSPLDNIERFDTLGNNGLRMGFAEYIAAVDSDGPVSSIADVVAFNEQDPEHYAAYGQTLLEAAAASDATPVEYEALGAQLRDEARHYIDGLLADNDVDVIVSKANLFSGAYAVAGYPSVTVPAGVDDLFGAVGVTFTGGYLQDGEVLGFAYAFEQASGLRVAPAVGSDAPEDE